jgi:Lon protease-like protein
LIVDLSFDRASFSGHAPLFPLPSVVLLPGAVLPLHVFEPRYRAMVKDALAGEKLIAMALLRPGYEAEYEGAPEIEPVVGLGRIVAHSPLPDGRCNMVLVGLRRARVTSEDRSRPYRLASLEVLEDVDDTLTIPDAAALRESTATLLRGVAPELVRDPARLEAVLSIDVPPGVFLDLAADVLELGVRDKQSLLDEPRVSERGQLLAAIVERRKDEHRKLRGGRKWPPEPSRN